MSMRWHPGPGRQLADVRERGVAVQLHDRAVAGDARPQRFGQVGGAACGGQPEGDPGRGAVALAQRRGGAVGDDAPAGEHDDAVGQALGLAHVVRGEEDRPAPGAQAGDELPRRAAGGGVEPGRRLVEEQQLGIADQGEREVEAAPLASRERRRLNGRPRRPARPARASRPRAAGVSGSRRTARRPRGRSARDRARTPASRCRCGHAMRGSGARGRRRARRPRRPSGSESPRGSRRRSSCPRRWGRPAPPSHRDATSRSMPRRASRSPKRLRRPRTRIAGSE